MMNTRIREYREGIDISFPNGLYLRFKKEDRCVVGITDVRLNKILFRNSQYPIRPLIKTTSGEGYNSCKYVNYEKEADRIIIHTLLMSDKRGTTDKLDWILMPKEVNINNAIYKGFSYCYRFSSKTDKVEQIVDRATWEIGGNALGNVVTGYNGNAQPEEVIGKETDFFVNEWGRFVNRQCFDYQVANSGGLLGYFEKVYLIKSGIFSPRDSNLLYHIDTISLPTKQDVATPMKTVLFSEHKGLDQWANIQDYLRNKYCSRYNIHNETPLPTLNVSRKFYANSREISFQKVSDKLLLKATELGFKRIYLGPIWWDGLKRRTGCSVSTLTVKEFGGEEELKVLCDNAHKLELEIIAWAPAGYLVDNSPLIKEHPDWVVEGESPFLELTGVNWESGYQNYFLEKLRNIKDNTGLDGLWLDSFSYVFESKDKQQVDKFLEVVSKLQRYGYILYSEAMSPFALFSSEMHLSFLAREKGCEHYAYGSSRYYIGPPNPVDFPGRVPLETVDFFKYYANKAAMILEYDRIKENSEVEAKLKKLNHCYNRVINSMEKRHLIENDKGVEWRNSGNEDLILFAYSLFPYEAPKNRIVYEVKSEGLQRIGKGLFNAEPFHIYWIRSEYKKWK